MLFVLSLYGFTFSPWEEEASASKTTGRCQCGNGKFNKTFGPVRLPDVAAGAVQRASLTAPAAPAAWKALRTCEHQTA